MFEETGIDANDVCALDELSSIDPQRTGLFLVDHNVPRGIMAEMYEFDDHPETKELVQGVIDHHEDENYFPNTRAKMDRYDVQESGSCSSLITKWIMEESSPDQTHSNASNGAQFLRQNPSEAHGIARLLLSAILIDTVNLTQKVTAIDTKACQFLAKFIPDVSFTTIYHTIQSAKLSIDSMTLQDLLRRDYKQYSTTLGTLGMSTVNRGISFLRTHFPDFGRDVQSFVTQRGLKTYIIMTVAENGKRFERGGMMLTDCKDVMEEFEMRGGEKYGIRRIAEKLNGIKDGWMGWIYEQDDVSASRKKVAPLILDIMSNDRK